MDIPEQEPLSHTEEKQKNASSPEAVKAAESKTLSTVSGDFISLDNGSVRTIPKLRATERENPMHVGVTANIPSTPGYFRVLTPMLMMRYMSEGLINLGFNIVGRKGNSNPAASLITKSVENHLTPVRNLMDKAMQAGVTPDDLSSVDERLFKQAVGTIKSTGRWYQSEDYLKKLYEQRLNIEEYKDFAKDGGQGENLINKVKEAVSNVGKDFDGDENNLIDQIKQAFSHVGDAFHEMSEHHKLSDQINRPEKNYEYSLKDLEKDVRSTIDRKAFDAILGLSCTGATLYYASRVYSDIHKTYAETIAYEKYEEGKTPNHINIFDIMSSDNKIVKDTWENYIGKNVARLTTDALFFGRQLGAITPFKELEAIPFGTLMLGAKGWLLLSETQRTHTSMFDDLLNLIDRKLNPQHGLGEPIRASDLFDLYQKYELTNDPSKMFKDATRHDQTDDAKWRQANLVFARMADMMNSTYKYKHDFNTDGSPLEHVENQILGKYQYFVLPKFLYLLGHDLIDLSQPERTLALAEIANQYSIQEVKALLAEEKETGKSLEQLLEIRPVDLEKTFKDDLSPELKHISETARSFKQGLIHKFLNEHPEVNNLYQQILQHEYGKVSFQQMPTSVDTEDFTELLQQTQRLIDKSPLDHQAHSTSNLNMPIHTANNIVPFPRDRQKLSKPDTHISHISHEAALANKSQLIPTL